MKRSPVQNPIMEMRAQLFIVLAVGLVPAYARPDATAQDVPASPPDPEASYPIQPAPIGSVMNAFLVTVNSDNTDMNSTKLTLRSTPIEDVSVKSSLSTEPERKAIESYSVTQTMLRENGPTSNVMNMMSMQSIMPLGASGKLSKTQSTARLESPTMDEGASKRPEGIDRIEGEYLGIQGGAEQVPESKSRKQSKSLSFRISEMADHVTGFQEPNSNTSPIVLKNVADSNSIPNSGNVIVYRPSEVEEHIKITASRIPKSGSMTETPDKKTDSRDGTNVPNSIHTMGNEMGHFRITEIRGVSGSYVDDASSRGSIMKNMPQEIIEVIKRITPDRMSRSKRTTDVISTHGKRGARKHNSTDKTKPPSTDRSNNSMNVVPDAVAGTRNLMEGDNGFFNDNMFMPPMSNFMGSQLQIGSMYMPNMQMLGQSSSMPNMPMFSQSQSVSNVPMFGQSQSVSNVPMFSQSHGVSNVPMIGQSQSVSNVPMFSQSHGVSNVPMFGQSQSVPNVPMFGQSQSESNVPMYSQSQSVPKIQIYSQSQSDNQMPPMLPIYPNLMPPMPPMPPMTPNSSTSPMTFIATSNDGKNQYYNAVNTMSTTNGGQTHSMIQMSGPGSITFSTNNGLVHQPLDQPIILTHIDGSPGSSKPGVRRNIQTSPLSKKTKRIPTKHPDVVASKPGSDPKRRTSN